MKPPTTTPVCVILLPSMFHVFWSWKITHINNGKLYEMHRSSEVLFYCFRCSGFLVLTYNIPKMIISEKNVAKVMWCFLESTIVVTWLYLWLTDKMWLCRPTVNDGWVVEIQKRFSCKVANLTMMFCNYYCCICLGHAACFLPLLCSAITVVWFRDINLVILLSVPNVGGKS